MNARVDLNENGVVTAAMHQLLLQIVGSPLFARAPRTCTLLSYLVGKKLAGKEHEITEQAIGLTVFRRDARSYDTSLDPVVRVQMGRLRARLTEYHATHGAQGLRLTVPLGSYVPVFSNISAAPTSAMRRPLQLAPLRNLAVADAAHAFVAGVDEELSSQLFQTFGSLVQLPQQTIGWETGETEIRHRLEGSIRVERNHVRASMRLIDTRAGDIAWLSQFDCDGELNMSLQEKLASAICVKLHHYLATS